MKKILIFFALLSASVFAVTPFPSVKHHKVFLPAISSPYLLETSFVLAENDTKAAISSDLYGYEYVIVTASEALTPGQQVKLKEE